MPSPMYRTVGIVSRPRQEDIAAVAPKLIAWLESRGLSVLYDKETAGCLVSSGRECSREDLTARVDLVVVLGGDGTLLATARAFRDSSVPVLPINLGGLGFLTSVKLGEMYAILEEVLQGRNRVSERSMLEAQITRAGKVVELHRALNDAVLNKGALARIIDLDLHLNGEFVTSYKADGLIISTPTGSTAYSLAAGGPIVYPKVPAFVLTPICPHTLTNRPLIVPSEMTLTIFNKADDKDAFLTIDGQVGQPLMKNDRVECRISENSLHLIRPPRTMFFDVLRQKLKWGER